MYREHQGLRLKSAGILLGSLVAVGGCGGDSPEATCTTASCGAQDGAATPPTTGPTSATTGGTSGVGQGTTGSAATTGGTTGSGGNTATGGDVSGPNLPCDVSAIVQEKCQECHSDPPVGAYMPLVTLAHFHAPAPTDESRETYELAKERINASSNPMPPKEPFLTPAEKATLNAWLEAGAPGSAETCQSTGAQTSDGGVPTKPAPDYGENIDVSGLECFKFTAHENGNKDAPYPVGTAVDKYVNINFASPWQGKVYAVVIRPIIDNAQVLHHWLFYRQPGGVDGTVDASGGWHATGELLAGWAPGGIALDFGEHGDVGLEMDDAGYLVEFHYNSADAAAVDRSGVEVCVRRDAPEHVAGMSWLGYDNGIESYTGGALVDSSLSGACLNPLDTWVGTCAPEAQEPIHLLYMVPHMHEGGTRMTGIIKGPNGERVLHDEPFDFNYQTTYKTQEVLMPGESITTTCNFNKPSCVGQATGAEMCYLFTYSYPKGALKDDGSWGSLAHGEGACLGQ